MSEVTAKFNEIKNDFDKAENWFNSAEEELIKVYRKLKLAESHANGFQDPATPIMEGIISFNGLLMTFMLLIACFVGWFLYQSSTLCNEQANKEPASFNHSTLLEVVWTITAAGILMIISIPSYNLLCANEVIDPSLTIKVVGHQWYWSYECSDFEVAPKVTGENLELIEKSVKNLKDWVELVESHELGNSEKEIEHYTTLINKLGLNKGNTHEPL